MIYNITSNVELFQRRIMINLIAKFIHIFNNAFLCSF